MLSKYSNHIDWFCRFIVFQLNSDLWLLQCSIYIRLMLGLLGIALCTSQKLFKFQVSKKYYNNNITNGMSLKFFQEFYEVQILLHWRFSEFNPIQLRLSKIPKLLTLIIVESIILRKQMKRRNPLCRSVLQFTNPIDGCYGNSPGKESWNGALAHNFNWIKYKYVHVQ